MNGPTGKLISRWGRVSSNFTMKTPLLLYSQQTQKPERTCGLFFTLLRCRRSQAPALLSPPHFGGSSASPRKISSQVMLRFFKLVGFVKIQRYNRNHTTIAAHSNKYKLGWDTPASVTLRAALTWNTGHWLKPEISSTVS